MTKYSIFKRLDFNATHFVITYKFTLFLHTNKIHQIIYTDIHKHIQKHTHTNKHNHTQKQPSLKSVHAKKQPFRKKGRNHVCMYVYVVLIDMLCISKITVSCKKICTSNINHDLFMCVYMLGVLYLAWGGYFFTEQNLSLANFTYN